jgi:hypothetical protein
LFFDLNQTLIEHFLPDQFITKSYPVQNDKRKELRKAVRTYEFDDSE